MDHVYPTSPSCDKHLREQHEGKISLFWFMVSNQQWQGGCGDQSTSRDGGKQKEWEWKRGGVRKRHTLGERKLDSVPGAFNAFGADDCLM